MMAAKLVDFGSENEVLPFLFVAKLRNAYFCKQDRGSTSCESPFW